jgi:hypothetical protein
MSLYLLGVRVSSTAARILAVIVECELAGSPFQGTQKEVGKMMGRHRVTVARALGELVGGGWVKSVRRGRKLPNVYYIGRKLRPRLKGG